METSDRVRELTASFLRTHGARIEEELSKGLDQAGSMAFLPTHRALFHLARTHIQEPSHHRLIADICGTLPGGDSRSVVQGVISGQLVLWAVLHSALREVPGPHRDIDIIHHALALVGDTVDGIIGALADLARPGAAPSGAPFPEWGTLVEFGKIHREFQALSRITRDLLDTRDPAQMFQILEQGILSTFHIRSLVIAAVDHEKGGVEVFRAYPLASPTSPDPIGWRFDLSHPDILCDVARTGRIEVIDGWDPRFHERIVQPDGSFAFLQRPRGAYKNQTSFFVPILAGDRAIGVVCTASPQTDRQLVLRQIERMRPFFDQVGATLSNVSEIIERRRTEETLQVTNRRLEEALAELQAAQQEFARQERLRALGRMASGIAHDFNNALSPIMGYSEMLLAGTIDLDDRERVSNSLRIMNLAARDAAKIVSRLREFYRPREEGEIFLPVDLNQLIEQTISLTQPRWKTQAQANGVVVKIKTRLQKTPPASGNETDLREMLANLIFNAVDAMPDGGTVTLRTRVEGERVILEVSDTGTGMTEEVRQRCLEPFFTTKGEYGTGLGLAMVYGIIRRHEGTIDIQSALGRGTTFVIRLPALTGQKTEKRGEKAFPPARPLRVLAVDDEPRVLGVLKEYLTGDGHTVETASSGREGIEKFRADRFDLVVTNRAMPGLSGDRLAGLVKEVAPDTPVILLTGFSEFMDAAGERPEGVDLVLSKPLTLAALREAVARVSAPERRRLPI
ncbi:MAG: hypothetical protein A3F84_05090 [Candidatus Handelsmanbacteria bacterium RIFCSPLOWO2_12_FULL_64_10]|uniref:histidine kinase n=1 Tax=Handelsmanbacteria sp. (strain RIFCSPLOWO2_12_FULL_64_10) TaxID=1817868 RepID=A0A1F6CVR5_HANXR|nr:MAG: hypothetical protein A3F84_05090 [Candidatus Handelsmanbacteria bacterium RIFCSPLOWO2_12_FULL_64_10]